MFVIEVEMEGLFHDIPNSVIEGGAHRSGSFFIM